MRLLDQWRWLGQIRHNPIYLREKGVWGKPNPFYDNLSRFSPFVILGALVLGLCTGFSNPALFSGDDAMTAFYCFICIPNMLGSALSLYGSMMVPSLTAPAISLEIDQGSWDILRVIPQPTSSILIAKLLGALARLRIWPVLFLLSLLQGLIIACSVSVAGGSMAIWGPLLGIMTVARPWLEIFFAALAGMVISTAVRSATISLVASYGAVIMLRLFNSSSLWMGLTSLLGQDTAIPIAGTAGPVVVYTLIIIGLWLTLIQRADR